MVKLAKKSPKKSNKVNLVEPRDFHEFCKRLGRANFREPLRESHTETLKI